MGKLAVITTDKQGVQEDLYPITLPQGVIDDKDKRPLSKDLIKIKDKEHKPSDFSGLGRVYLEKNIKEGKNILTQDMINKSNTIYIIEYDFDLNGEEITIPEGCVLDFQGGSLSNGTIVGNGTVITTARNGGIFNNVYFSGTYNITHIYDNWFLDSKKDLLKRLFALTSDNLYNVVHIDKDHIIEIDEHRNGVVVNSNTDICLTGTIQISPNSFEWYQIIQILNKSNISISGTGAIIGDRNNHLGNTGENGEGINIEHSENINIEGIKISNCWGDGIYIGGNRSDVVSKNININNVEIYNCRRQGISITHCDGFTFSNLNIYDIYGTNPQSALDIEPNENKKVVNGVISNSNLIGTNGVLLLNQNPSINIINNIQFINCYISTSNDEGNAYVVQCFQINENVKFIGCTLFNVSIEKTIYIDNGQNKIEFYDCIIGNKELVDRAFISGGGCIVNGCRLYTGIYTGVNYFHDIKTYITNTILYGKTNTVIKSVIKDCTVFGGIDADSSHLENNEIKGSGYLNAASFYGDSKLVLRNGSVAKNNKIEYDGDIRITSGVVLYNDIILIENNINCNAGIVLYSVSNRVTDIVIDNNIEGYIDGNFAIFKSRALTQGTTRPSLTSKDVGFQFFDLSINPNKPIYWTGTKWVDATGADV